MLKNTVKKAFFIILIFAFNMVFLDIVYAQTVVSIPVNTPKSEIVARINRIIIIPVQKKSFSLTSNQKYAEEIFYYLIRSSVRGNSINYIVFDDGSYFVSNTSFQANLSPSNLGDKEIAFIYVKEEDNENSFTPSGTETIKYLIQNDIIPVSDITSPSQVQKADMKIQVDSTQSSIFFENLTDEGLEQIVTGLDFDKKQYNPLEFVSAKSRSAYQPGSVVDVEFTIKNKLAETIYFGESLNVFVKTENDSELFVSDSWSTTRIAFIDKNGTLSPSSSRTYLFKIFTPLMPGKYTQKYGLYSSDQKITDFDLEYEVLDIGQKILRVRNNPIDYLTVRELPTRNSPEVGRAPHGKEYQFFELKDGFYRINFNGKEGWVSANYVQVIKN
jgi:hypothetical protein